MHRRTILIIRILSVVVLVAVAFIISTVGLYHWRKGANYPPPIEHPSVRGWISLIGQARDHRGLAVWSSDGSGQEPAAVGHSLQTVLGNFTAPYYVSTRDYGDIDPLSSAGMTGIESSSGFFQLMKVLYEHDLIVSDLSIAFPLFSLGEDREGEDWIFRDGVETRYLKSQGDIIIRLQSQDMISLPVTRLTWIQDFRGAVDLSDVSESCMTNAAVPEDASENSMVHVRVAASAFLKDMGELKIRIVIENLKFTDETFSGKGRIQGRFGEVHRARLEIVP
jgi:hypothetical protein